jgi:8-oxo-dGTP pyrophosphatase MutT (NUDIX family)
MQTQREFACLAEARAFDPARFLRLRMGSHDAGWIRRDLAQHLRAWPGLFRFEACGVTLSPLLGTEGERTAALAGVIERLAAMGVIGGWRDERYAVFEYPGAAPLAFIERAAARFFGVHTFAAHCNGFTRHGENILMWIARRSAAKPIDPAALDNLVGGGIAHGCSPRDTLFKEGWEEAGIPPELLARATPGRSLQILREVAEGCQQERVYVHDLELPSGFEPVNRDGEVAEFSLCPLHEVVELIAAGELTVDASLVALDFLFRRGLLREADHPDFREVVR